MNKVLCMTAALFMAATSFAQTDAKTAEAKTAPVAKKARVISKKTLKPTTADAATKAMDAEKMQAVKMEEEKMAAAAAPVAPVQVAQPAPLQDVSKAFEFKNDAFDFGKIPAGKPTKYDLYIKNVSKETQELTLVQPGCGCTTPEYEKDKKIAPGETVKVVLGYNGGAPGNGSPFSKSVTVSLKGFQPKIVTFKGETYAVPTESAPANGAIDKLKPATEATKH